MRPVNKGAAPRPSYPNYRDARPELLSRLGVYCSFCEMPIYNMPEVEHVWPINRGGPPDHWDNFPLACRYCNSLKSDHNLSRNSYFWPDLDNTFRAFMYRLNQPMTVGHALSSQESAVAQAMLDLCGLDRHPNGSKQPTVNDMRFLSQHHAWQSAASLLQDWHEYPSEAMARSISEAAFGRGHFSIFMEVFKEVPLIRQKLIEKFPGTASDCFDHHTQPVKRPTGNL